jgi:hypothetical protein
MRLPLRVSLGIDVSRLIREPLASRDQSLITSAIVTKIVGFGTNFDIAQDKNPRTIAMRDVSLLLDQAVCPQRTMNCFIFDADLIETLHQAAEELCAAVERSFANSSDLEAATSLIVKTLVNSAVDGERDASTLKAEAVATLEKSYPSIAFNETFSQGQISQGQIIH